MTPEPPAAPSSIRFAIGIAMGLVLGFFIGIALDSFSLGVPLGIGGGVALVWLFDRLRFGRSNDEET